MTPAEWEAQFEAWRAIQKRHELVLDVLDFQFSRICAYIRNWSGRSEEAVRPVDLMLNSPKKPEAAAPQSEEEAKQQAIRHAAYRRSLWEGYAARQKQQ